MQKRFFFKKKDIIPKTLFGCTRIHLNQCVLEWIGVELKLNSTLTHSNTHESR